MAKKEVRFSELVRASGQPEVVSLWTDPRLDRGFQRAVKQNRVLTVVQASGTKKQDFGRIGFHRLPHATYMIFPEPLPEGNQPRVIGIKYQLALEPKVDKPVTIRHRGSDRKVKRQPTSESVFDVIVRRVAVLESSVRIKARSQPEAEKKGLAMAKEQSFDPAKAILNEEVRAVQQVKGRETS